MRLHVLGSINLDIISEVSALPRPGETVLALRTTEGPGGKGANQARAAARFGARVSMHGAVGADDAGRRLRAGLAAEGVDIAGVAVRTDAPTGRAHVMVSADGENMIVVDGGANRHARFTPSSAAGPALFLAQLETPARAAAAMFGLGQAGDLRVLNAAPAIPEGRDLFPLADLIVLNEVELAVYAGSAPTEDADIAVLARRLITREDQYAVVTLGGGGAMIVGRRMVEHIPGRTVEAVDTTGAGDCFVGVLSATLASGAALIEAVRIANLAASLSVQRLGADAAPTRAEVARLCPQLLDDAPDQSSD